MKKILLLVFTAILLCNMSGCDASAKPAQIAVTTLPVYEFTVQLCQGTGISVTQLVTESVSCLHDYTLQVSQMQTIEAAQLIILSGAGLEDFLADALSTDTATVDASAGIALLCGTHEHEHEHDHGHEHEHSHENDPHIWLSPANAKQMAQNICIGLKEQYPHYADTFEQNLQVLLEALADLEHYGQTSLAQLSCRELVTFHDGFGYLADAFGLTVLKAIEDESGSEASAAEIIELTKLVNAHHLPAIFTEKNGSASAASIISAETGIPCYALDMALSGSSYFEAMYQNIDTLKEALG